MRRQKLEFCAIKEGRHLLGLKPPKKEKSYSSSGVTNNAALMIRLRSQEESKYTVGQRYSHGPGKSGNSGKLHLRKGWIRGRPSPPRTENQFPVSSIHHCMHVCMLSCVWLFVTPWTTACQAHLPMGFPKQEYWNGFSLPSPGDLADPGIKPVSLNYFKINCQYVKYHSILANLITGELPSFPNTT